MTIDIANHGCAGGKQVRYNLLAGRIPSYPATQQAVPPCLMHDTWIGEGVVHVMSSWGKDSVSIPALGHILSREISIPLPLPAPRFPLTRRIRKFNLFPRISDFSAFTHRSSKVKVHCACHRRGWVLDFFPAVNRPPQFFIPVFLSLTVSNHPGM